MRSLILPHYRTYFPFKMVLPLVMVVSFLVLSVVYIERLQAQTPEIEKGSFSEREAQNIDRMIMCPVCPAETIDQAQVQISQQMRQIVREMLAEGKERQEILEFFVDRYGQDILGAPPKTGVNLVAWVTPAVGVAGGLLAVFFILRSMTRREPTNGSSELIQDAELIPYLQLIDRHLDMTRFSNQVDDIIEPSNARMDIPEKKE